MIFDIRGIFYRTGDLRSRTAETKFFKPSSRSVESSALVGTGDLRAMVSWRGQLDVIDDLEMTILSVGEIFLNEHSAGSGDDIPRRLGAADIRRLYDKRGIDLVHSLKGNYQLIVLAKQSGTLYVFNGRGAVSPFYYRAADSEFSFSTSLAHLQRFHKCAMDRLGIAEFSILGFPLGDRTFFETINCLPPASRLTVNEDRCVRHEFFSDVELLGADDHSLDDTLELGSELFQKAVALSADGGEKVNLSLTGGFDGRAILSALEYAGSNRGLAAYSFGIKGSDNIKIPQLICRKENVVYRPIYLDDNYERSYNEYALQAVMQSDCMATFERANYPYAFQLIRAHSPVAITGIFGSELLRTFQNVAVGSMISPNFIEYNFAADKKAAIRSVCRNAQAQGYYGDIILRDLDSLVEHIYQESIARYRDVSDKQRFYLFMLRQSARRYFSGEVHMERIYCTNRFPFYDDDFVDFICRSRLSGVHRNPLRPTIRDRIDSQVFYSYVMRKYKPSMLMYDTDHGYRPRSLMTRVPLLEIGPRFVLHKVRQKLTAYREFKTDEWSSIFYREVITPGLITPDIFSSNLIKDRQEGRWRSRSNDFARAVSLAVYLDRVDRGDQL